MAVTVQAINAAANADTFGTLYTRVNSVIDYLATVVVTANGDANGSQTTGNAYVNGIFASKNAAFGTIRGGNVQSSADLVFASNASWGNSTVNSYVSNGTARFDTSMTVAGFVMNSTSTVLRDKRDRVFVNGTEVNTATYVNFIAGTGVSLTGSYDAGNNSVNVIVAATIVQVTGSNTDLLFNDSGALGANDELTFDKVNAVLTVSGQTNAALKVGANAKVNSTSVSVGNSTVSTLQNSTAHSVSNSTTTVSFTATGVLGGTGFFINADTFSTGNSTVNSTMNTTSFKLANSTQSVQFNMFGIGGIPNFTFSSGNATVNSTVNSSAVTSPNLVGNGVTANVSVAVGANVIANTTAFFVGNATVNVVINSSMLRIGTANVWYAGNFDPTTKADNGTIYSVFSQNTYVNTQLNTKADNTAVYSTFAQNTGVNTLLAAKADNAAVYAVFAQNTATQSALNARLGCGWATGRQSSALNLDWRDGLGDASLQLLVDGTSAIQITTRSEFLNYAAGKPFIIDHPTPSKTVDKYLVHACIEGPEAGVYYRGKGITGADGTALVHLPDYFTDLCEVDTATIQLTQIGRPIPISLSADEVTDAGAFTVYANPGTKFHWLVMAERKDCEKLVPEVDKSEVEVGRLGPYTYFMERG